MIGAADRKADAHAGLLGREEGWNRFGLSVVAANPEPVSETAISIMSSAALVFEAISSRCVELRHRFQRVAEQIDQHLLDLDPVGQHQVARRVEVEAQLTRPVRGRR